VGVAIFEMMEYGEKKVEEGTMKKNRLILPGQHRIRKWITSIGREDSGLDGDGKSSTAQSIFCTQNEADKLQLPTPWKVGVQTYIWEPALVRRRIQSTSLLVLRGNTLEMA
jgi:hypothetical protein